MFKKNAATIIGTLGFCMLGQFACDEDETKKGEGTLEMSLWGEEYIEEGLPNDVFADDYAVTFTKFLIVLSEISAAEDGTSPALTAPKTKIWDMTKAGPVEIASKTVPEGDYTHTAYRIAPAETGAVSGNASEEDVERMIVEGLSIYVEGTASDGTAEFTFAWGFDTDTMYDPCHSTGALAADGDATIQITIHGDHLFYDSAISEEPDVRFNDIALADSDGDAVITETELQEYDITPLPNYTVGSLDITNMYDFIAHMTSTLGHIDGEGHCEF